MSTCTHAQLQVSNRPQISLSVIPQQLTARVQEYMIHIGKLGVYSLTQGQIGPFVHKSVLVPPSNQQGTGIEPASQSFPGGLARVHRGVQRLLHHPPALPRPHQGSQACICSGVHLGQSRNPSPSESKYSRRKSYWYNNQVKILLLTFYSRIKSY